MTAEDEQVRAAETAVESGERFSTGRRPRREVNPLLVKELRGQMRGKRAFVVLSVYLLFLTGLTGILYVLASAGSGGPASSPRMADLGKAVFYGIVVLEMLMVAFIAPAFSAATINGERERRTYELLRTTLLSAWQVVLGKLVAALSYVALLILVALPVQGLAFVFGGVEQIELGIALVMLLMAAFTFAAVGVFYSAVARSTLVSTVLTYATVFVATIGVPALVLLVAGIGVAPLLSTGGAPQLSVGAQTALLYAGLFFASLSPLSAAIVGEVFLTQQDALFLTWQPVGANTLIPVPSPWIVYLVLYLIVAVVALAGAVRRVNRQETT